MESTSPEEASAEAVHKAKNAAQAIEVARAVQTKASMIEALQEVFGETEPENPKEMRILVQRIPILCSTVLQMHADIASIKDNLQWGVRIALGALITGVIAFVFFK